MFYFFCKKVTITNEELFFWKLDDNDILSFFGETFPKSVLGFPFWTF